MNTTLDLQSEKSPVLVCFAVKEEAKFFQPVFNRQFLVTGMGRKNAAESFRSYLEVTRPALVVTSGFAGGLNPELAVGTVIFEEDVEAGLEKGLKQQGAASGQFYCSERVAITVAEKAELWKTTGADAVEMESAVIRTICKEHRIPSATVRVISDAAQDDLPLDFNALMDSNDRINYGRLMWQLARSPRVIPQLMKFQKQLGAAAKKLGDALNKSLPGCGC